MNFYVLITFYLPFQNALFDAFKNRSLDKFKFALERLKADPNAIIDERVGASIFKLILREPKSEEYIELCIEHGADLYEVKEFRIFRAVLSRPPGSLE